MKKFLTILTLFAGLVGFGQMNNGIAVVRAINGFDRIEKPPAPDTLACIFLVCDTTALPQDFSFFLVNYPGMTQDSTQKFGPFNRAVPYVFWLRGYYVFQPGAGILAQLDEKKKPFGKNIIVWFQKQ